MDAEILGTAQRYVGDTAESKTQVSRVGDVVVSSTSNSRDLFWIAVMFNKSRIIIDSEVGHFVIEHENPIEFVASKALVKPTEVADAEVHGDAMVWSPELQEAVNEKYAEENPHLPIKRVEIPNSEDAYLDNVYEIEEETKKDLSGIPLAYKVSLPFLWCLIHLVTLIEEKGYAKDGVVGYKELKEKVGLKINAWN